MKWFTMFIRLKHKPKNKTQVVALTIISKDINVIHLEHYEIKHFLDATQCHRPTRELTGWSVH